jgi:hypothetical protein
MKTKAIKNFSAAMLVRYSAIMAAVVLVSAALAQPARAFDGLGNRSDTDFFTLTVNPCIP